MLRLINKEVIEMKTSSKPIMKTVAAAVTVIIILWIIYLALTPVISRDALILHMAFTKIWLDRGFLYFQDYNLSSLGMMNLDFIYSLSLKIFTWEGFPKIIHSLFLLLSAFVMYSFLNVRFGKRIAFCLSMIFLTIPINQRLASEVYVDLGVLFFSTLAIIFFIKWLESDRIKNNYIYFSALTSGLATGTKFSAAILTASLIFIIGLSSSKKHRSVLHTIKISSLYFLIVLLVISPWMIRNYISVGNPVHPLLNSVFSPDVIKVDSSLEQPASEYTSRILQGETVLSIIFIPLRLFFSGKDNDLLSGFDGVLNPLLLLLFLPLLFPGFIKNIPEKLIVKHLNYLFILSLIFFLVYGHLRIRYFIYIVPLLIILNAYFFSVLKKHFRRNMFLIISGFILTIFILINLSYSVNLFKTLGTSSYIFGDETKNEYLRRTLKDYDIAQKINQTSPENSVFYEVLCGHRTYYFNRPVVFDDYILDRYFFNLISSGAETGDYLEHLSRLPFREYKKADYLMIRPFSFTDSYKNIFSGRQTEYQIGRNIFKFREFLNQQIYIYDKNGIYIYKLKYPNDGNRE